MKVEDERALREGTSDPLGLESCAATARDNTSTGKLLKSQLRQQFYNFRWENIGS